jgi:hypothetical protein
MESHSPLSAHGPFYCDQLFDFDAGESWRVREQASEKEAFCGTPAETVHEIRAGVSTVTG